MIKTKTDHRQEIIKLIKQASYSKDTWKIFSDFCEMTAITISNSCDPTQREERENRYLDIIRSYEKREQKLFPDMFAHLVLALEEKTQTNGTEDVLGVIFHELELHNKWKAQFFTPQHISDMMAKMVCGDETQTAIQEQGYISVLEPACGSGVMLTSFCKAMKENGLNYCDQLVVMAVDVDEKCAHMTYIQMALYGVPAVIIHGNSLSLQEFSRWYTPIYVLNGWVWCETFGLTTARNRYDEMLKCCLEPSYATWRQVEALLRATPPTDTAAKSQETTVLTVEDTSPTNQQQMRFDVDMEAVRVPESAGERKPKIAKPTLEKELEQMQLSLFPDS